MLGASTFLHFGGSVSCFFWVRSEVAQCAGGMGSMVLLRASWAVEFCIAAMLRHLQWSQPHQLEAELKQQSTVPA